MTVNLKLMTYTKDNGETSDREVIVVSEPRDNYLMFDVTKLDDDNVDNLIFYLEEIDSFRKQMLKIFEESSEVKISSLWRSFKPEGIEWT